jgi:alpha-1,2-mannosyltransferase
VRLLVVLSLGIATGLFTFAVGVGVTDSWPAATALGVLAGGLVGGLFWKRRFVELDETAASRGLAVVSAVSTVLAFVQLVRVTVFMVAPARTDLSAIPSSTWEVQHSCVSAYYVAAKAAVDSNVYEKSLYTAPDDNPAAIRKPRMIGPFNIDVYEYPPPFLTLPRWLMLVAPEFLAFRMVWFGLNGLTLLLAFVLVARSLGPAAGTRALLLAPLVMASIPTITFMQKGNVQGVMIAMAMIAMLLFERRRWAWGGALLAFAMVSKLFPGLLLVYLLAQRRWRAVFWTVGFAALFALVTLVDLGAAPYAGFLEHLPGLVGGEAFPQFRNPAAMALNYSVPGIVFKLKLFGVPGMGFGASKLVGWLYTAGVVAGVWLVGRRTLRDDDKPLVWLAILVLATLRSPFLPQGYGVFPSLWLVTLLAAKSQPNAKTLGLVVTTWLALNVYWPLDWPMNPKLLAGIILLPQAVTFALAVLVMRRVWAERVGRQGTA